MFDKASVKYTFSRAAATYDANAPMQQKVHAHCVTLARQYWPEGTDILDIGCGTGALFSENLWNVTGIDLAFGMCELARKKNAAVINADAALLPFSNAAFSGIFSSLMLQWASDPVGVLREMAHMLRPGGVAVVSTFTEGTLRELREAFASVDDSSHVSPFLTKDEVIRCVHEAGLAIVSCEPEYIRDCVPGATSLMRSLKAIGATHKGQDRRKGMLTPRQLAVLEEAYAAEKDGLPVSWNILYLVLRKSG